MKVLFSFLCLIGTSVVFAQSNVIEHVANISSVMVYNSSAEIHYEKMVSVPKGKSTIVFTDLTPFLVDNTLNVTIENENIDIINVSEKINHIRARKANNSKISSLKDSLKRLRSEAGLLGCKVDALNKEKELLFKNEAIGGVSQGVAVDEIEKAADFFSKRYYNLNTKLFYLAGTELSLNRRISRFSNQISSLGTNTTKPGSEIEITITSSAKQNANIKFQFLTSKGGWAPMYDCKYQGPDKPIKFVFRANVYNASGTPWKNVKVQLSTASPMQGFSAPSINDKGGRSVAESNGKVKFKTIQVANAIATYKIKHKQTIPSDSKPYLMDVEAYEMKASFHYLVIPKLDPFGFLMAKVPDWNRYNLIPGTTNVYNQGSYMGKTFLNTYSDNDTLNIYLGKDGKIQASKKEIIKNNKNNIIGNYYVEKSEIKITIDNKSNSSLPVEILDQVPVFSAKSSTKFNLQNISDAIHNEKDGLLTWKFTLAANTNRVIEYNFEIKSPKDERRPGVSSYSRSSYKFRTISCPSF